MKKMIRFILLVPTLIILVSGSLIGCDDSPAPFTCTDALGCVDIAPGEPVKLGMLRALKIGPDHHRGAELALAARNNQILGHPIELQVEDEGCTSEGGTVSALKLVADPQIVAVIGTTCSGAAITAAKIISDTGLVMVSGTNTAPSLTSINGQQGSNWQPGYLRTAHNFATGIQTAATFTYQELGISKVATINDGDAYTRGFTDLFQQSFKALDGEIVLDAVVNKGDLDMEPVLNAATAARAELIFLPLFSSEVELIVNQSQNASGLDEIALMGDGSLLDDSFVESVGEAGVGMYFVGRLPLESPAFNQLITFYETQYSEPTSSVGFSYIHDATGLILHAIEAVAFQEKNGTLHIGRQALRDELYATANFEGATGTFTCDKFGDCSTAQFAILRLDDPAAGIKGLLTNVIYPTESDQ